MSTESPQALGIAIESLKLGFTNESCQMAACVVYGYDRILTFSKEVNLIWRRRSMSVATGVYVLLHVSIAVYLYLYAVMIILTSCEVNGYVAGVVQGCAAILFRLSSGAFMTLRAYAISNRSVPLASVMVIFFLAPVAADIYDIRSQYTITAPQPISCIISSVENPTVDRALAIVEQTATLIPDILLVAATWRHAYTVKFARVAQISTPLTRIIIRDGVTYFIIVLPLLVINTALNATTSYVNGMLSPIVYSLQAVLLSRFFLSLNEANAYAVELSSTASQMSDLWFSRVVGSLAGSLAYDYDRSSESTEENMDAECELNSGEQPVQTYDMDARERPIPSPRPEV
ncbi:hypothetical protein DAEQUDRAFT_228864 [Daedalea quercina L-15889]|uniref:DUF6533 domain-containing protein n=1 Tax=Daedalea quercina L-15889 TaxID=1314783 RepID=A0A165R2I1_9APHY|nr:hypothetical protein DAEQUDRAFT_228864 [Daedalea quercina L-15889]